MANQKAAAASAGGSKRLIIIGAAVVLMAGAGVGGWMYLQKGKQAAAAPGHDAGAKAPEHAVAQYYKFDPAFVVNFGGAENSRFLQIVVEALTRDTTTLETIKTNEPAIRNDLLLLFSSQTYEALMSAEGKEALRSATTAAIRKVVAHEGAKPESIENVFFTSFVIQ
jgi:flagellar FliL protein